MNDLILNFPILTNDNNNFLDSVIYSVDAEQLQGKIHITHTLTGKSFIYDLITNHQAYFSVALFYKDNAERQYFTTCKDLDINNENYQVIAKQKIDIDFDYAPEITPNIFISQDCEITFDSDSGLDDFWQEETFNIPAYSKIAYHDKLTFNTGSALSLIDVNWEKNFTKGSVKTSVNEIAPESERPIKVACSEDVYDELHKEIPEVPTNSRTAFKVAIVTQILCHVYAYMSQLEDKEGSIHSGLLKHMQILKERTEQDWEDENFNASLAATKFLPYAINVLDNGDN